MYYRLLRPEFVRDRGGTVLDRLKVPPDHKFPTVKVANPMLFAIACAKLSKGRGQRATARTASMDGAEGNAEKRGRSGGVEQGGNEAGLNDESSLEEGKQESDGDAPPGPVELKEKQCGIDFVSKGETYFEGFVEEGEEELVRRGGVGYPPCYDSIVSDGYDPPDAYCSGRDGDDSDDDDGGVGDSDDGDSNLGLNGRDTSPAVHGSPKSIAGVATSGANSGLREEAENAHAGSHKASESSAVASTGRRGIWSAQRGVERACEMRKYGSKTWY